MQTQDQSKQLLQRSAIPKNEAEGIKTCIEDLPTEVFHYILKQLPVPKLLVVCRAVCSRWKDIVDDLVSSQEFWRHACEQDHARIYERARFRAKSDLSWRQLYKSIYLWRDLFDAKETWSMAIDVPSTIDFWSAIGFVNAWNGIIAAKYGTIRYLNGSKIDYYDAETFEMVNSVDVGCTSYGFSENENMIVFQTEYDSDDQNNELRIVPKANGVPIFENMIKIRGVNSYILFGDDICYTSLCLPQKSVNVYMCKFKDDYKCTLLKTFDAFNVTFGSSMNKLYVMLSTDNDYEVYKLIDDGFVIEEKIGYRTNPVPKFIDYGLLENVLHDEYEIFNSEHLQHVNVQQYGNIIFVSDTAGGIRIYDREAFQADEMTEPIKIFNLKYIFEDMVEHYINNIEVIEKENGHTLVVFTKKYVLLLQLDH